MKNIFTLHISFVFLFFSMLFPFQAHSTQALAEIQSPKIEIRSLAVLPFFRGKDIEQIDDPQNNTLSCPLVDLCVDENNFTPGAAKKLTRYTTDILEKRFQEKLIPFAEVHSGFERLTTDPRKDTPRSLAQRLGRDLQAEYVLVGAVWRYRERSGGAMASDTPATVAFVLYLVNVETGKKVWKRAFDKSQKALTDNVLEAKDFLKQGGKWLTAEELARFGLKKVLADFPAN